MNKTKIIFVVLAFILILFPFAGKAFAAPIPTPTLVVEINSFELFWPLAPGKTIDEPLYFLKDLKEKVRGFLIFASPQRLEYNVMLSAKRVIETEKLLKEAKIEPAQKTLEKALIELGNAEKNIEKSKSSNESLGQVSQGVSDRLLNIQKLVNWLATTNNQLEDKLIEVSSKASSLFSKL